MLPRQQADSYKLLEILEIAENTAKILSGTLFAAPCIDDDWRM